MKTFHVGKLSFSRLPSGDIQIRQGETVIDTIPSDGWVSVIATMSRYDAELSDPTTAYALARDLHQRTPLPTEAPARVVAVSLNAQPGSVVQVPAGKLPVSELKRMLSVHQVDTLAVVRDHRLLEIPEGTTVDVQGGESFVSWPPVGTSS